MAKQNYLIVNAFGRSNRGDSVLLDQCIDQIRLVNPAASITGIVFEDLDSAKAAHPTVVWTERIGNASRFSGRLARLESLAYLALAFVSLRLGWRGLAKLLPRDQQRSVEAFAKADIVVSAPGGYIHDTNLAYVIALYHIYLAEIVGIPSVLAPQSLGPLNSVRARRMALRVLSQCQALCVREKYSQSFLVDLGAPTDKIRLTGDSAFWDADVVVDAAEIDAELGRLGLQPGEHFIGCTIVDWTFPNLPNTAALRQRYFEGMAEVIGRVYATHGLRTLVFNQVASDLEAVNHVAGLAPQAVLVDTGDREPSMMRALIGRSHAFLGTRFHSCIFAMMTGRAVTAISYLPKTEFIMNELGLSADVVDIAKFDADEVYAKLASQLADINAAETRVRNAVALYQATQTQFHEVLRAVASR